MDENMFYLNEIDDKWRQIYKIQSAPNQYCDKKTIFCRSVRKERERNFK